MRRFLMLATAAAAAVYFFHPRQGRRRRALVRDRAVGLFQLARLTTQARAKSEERERPDDATLAHKVESELFRDDSVPKGQININAESGKVFLRGEVQTEDLIRELEERVRSIHGVQDVENLLHVPGTPAPMHQ